MNRYFRFLSIWADSISVVSFLFAVATSVPFIGPQILEWISALSIPLRIVVVAVFEIAIAYTLGELVKRLVQNEWKPIHQLPPKLVGVMVSSLLMALASMYNISRLLFLNRISFFAIVILFSLQIFFLWLRGFFLRSHFSSIRALPNEIPFIQRVFASATGIVLLTFLIQQLLQ